VPQRSVAVPARGEISIEKKQYWQRQLTGWRMSGETQSDFCRDRGLSRHSFQYWKRKFDRLEGPADAAFVEIDYWATQQREAESSGVRVRVCGRYEVEVAAGFDLSTLSRVIEVLESR